MIEWVEILLPAGEHDDKGENTADNDDECSHGDVREGGSCMTDGSRSISCSALCTHTSCAICHRTLRGITKSTSLRAGANRTRTTTREVGIEPTNVGLQSLPTQQVQ